MHPQLHPQHSLTSDVKPPIGPLRDDAGNITSGKSPGACLSREGVEGVFTVEQEFSLG